MLFPLMDMFFILLLFFLVTAGFSPKPPADKSVYSAVPRPDVGEAQFLLQMTSPTKIVWLDNLTFKGSWTNDFPAAQTIGSSELELEERLNRFVREYGDCLRDNVNAVIRCPDSLTYGDIATVQENLKLAFEKRLPDHNLQMSMVGCVGFDITVERTATVDGGKKVQLRW
jgi:biopolymer transport protein ExbD